MSNPNDSPPPRKGRSCLFIILAVLGGGALLTAAACGGLIFWMTSVPRGSGASRELFSYADVPIPDFPQERGEPIALRDEPELSRYEFLLGEQGGYYDTPGLGGKLWLYIPPGNHLPGTLPCVLLSADRLSRVAGAELDFTNEDEHAAYVKAGCVVVAYDLDSRNDATFPDDPAFEKQFSAFKNSRAGLVNARNALEFTLSRVPEVDPSAVFTAGLGTGGSHSLLFAAHEPRLAGCIALEPIIDGRCPISIATRSAGIAEENLAGGFVTETLPGTLIERFYGMCEMLV